MSKHLKGAIALLILGVGVIVAIKFIQPYFEERYKYKTSDAKATKGKITIALDNWIGYFPFQSPVFKKLMREAGYIIEVENDDANYEERMQKLKDGDIDFAVATVDSYLLNAAPKDFPATIITVIDESKGGDALVAWEDKIKSLDKLKTYPDYKIAFTPSSPSEHLLKSIGVHFGIPELLNKRGSWRVETEGSSKALKQVVARQVEAAVLWEPDVSKALIEKGIVKLLGTEDTEKLIVDILLVNRTYSAEKTATVSLFLTNYFRTLKTYQENSSMLEKDLVKYAKISEDQVQPILQGVRWISLFENAQWFGTHSEGVLSQEVLVDAIESTVDILVENNDFSDNPLPNQDAYVIINSSFVEELFSSGIAGDRGLAASLQNSLEREFAPLTDSEWNNLKEIGTLKIRPITFMSGTSEIDSKGRIQLDAIVENIKHYPNFRILVKGHTGTRGDTQANLQLSQERADAVKQFLENTYNIDFNRIRALGVGANKPLPKKSGESSRAYAIRLKRVEIRLVAGAF